MENPGGYYGSKWQVVSLAFELGFIIALPVLLFGLLGKYLDARLGTNPVFKTIGLLLALTSSGIWLTKRFSEVFKSLNNKDQVNKEDK